MLLTLLVNAREAIEDSRTRCGGLPEEGRVLLTLDSDAERLRVTVTDNGSGVPGKRHGRIFEPHLTIREGEGGSGLGLYIARMLVETGFGGTLDHAALPEGACFIIDLPVSAEEQS